MSTIEDRRAWGRRIIRLKDAIQASFDAGDWKELGLLTGCNDYVGSHPRLLRSLSWDDDDYGSNVLSVVEYMLAQAQDNLTIIANFTPVKTWLLQNDRELYNDLIMGVQGTTPRPWDVAISFAGTERQLAESLANILQAANYTVFYDDFYPDMLWGKDLVELFDDIYRQSSRFCVMFLSKEYVTRMWSTHERRSALARAIVERSKEYVLPIRIQEVEVPGLPPTVGYLHINKYSIEQIGEVLLKKLRT